MSGEHCRNPLPKNFRKLPIEERIALLTTVYNYDPNAPQIADAEVMIESAVGHSAIPLGVVPRVLVNSKWYTVPMTTEEPSVVAAQMMAAAIISRHGGVESEGGRALGIGQVFIQHCSRRQYKQIAKAQPELVRLLKVACLSLEQRGGGMQNSKLCWQQINKHEAQVAENQGRVALFEFTVDTVDAMGANRIILLAERIADWLRNSLKCDILMAILSNDLSHSPSTARFRIPTSALRAVTANPMHTAQKIVVAANVACVNRKRAVTHNKGIMNGICAIALATGNDTRAVEAAAHSYASISGQYRALSRYQITANELCGEVTLPLPLATVGGAAGIQHHARQAAAILQVKSAVELKRVAAAVGLQQNFAALLALTGDGIARGHIPLQQRRRAAATDSQQSTSPHPTPPPSTHQSEGNANNG